MSIENDLRELARRQEALTQRRTRAQFELDNAKAKFAQAKTELLEEFGLSSGEDIKNKIAELEAQRDELLAGIQKDMEAAGA